MQNFFTGMATSAISILVTLVAIYLSFRLLGKLAKFVITLVIIAFLIWLFVSDTSILNVILDYIKNA